MQALGLTVSAQLCSSLLEGLTRGHQQRLHRGADQGCVHALLSSKGPKDARRLAVLVLGVAPRTPAQLDCCALQIRGHVNGRNAPCIRCNRLLMSGEFLGKRGQAPRLRSQGMHWGDPKACTKNSMHVYLQGK